MITFHTHVLLNTQQVIQNQTPNYKKNTKKAFFVTLTLGLIFTKL
jgi:hypothetical protein